MRHNRKKSEILRAAARVFRQKGYHATRIQDVADALGMQKGSLYYYIKTKEDLLRGLVEDVLEQSVTLLHDIKDKHHTPSEKIRLCIESHLTLFHNNIDAFGVFINEDLHLINKNSDKDIFKLIKNYERGWLKIFEEGVKQGEFREGDYRMWVKGILGMLNWTYRWYHLSDGYSISEVSEIFADLILHGVLKNAPAKNIKIK
ncbi:MAG: TetR/AcrR family transcriptional regulator [Chitinophagales bacterium]|nr:TetR/AcrR family transcriptional regulator [Chitinophagales bacterium]MDW8419873.1 TetR/AcrR family transcriptional regulator [Chitinophagales bacterium]